MEQTNIIKGKAYYCNDYTDTDVMAPGRYDPIKGAENLAAIALIDYKGPTPFINKITNRSDYSIIVAGKEFGCGSSRETATLALLHAGVKVIIAKSFARIFYRNCINMGGLYPIAIGHNFDEQIFNQEITVDTQNRTIQSGDTKLVYPDFGPLQEIVESGGLANYTLKQMRSKK